MRHHHLLTYVGCQFVQTHYTEWGAADNPDVVFCVHGLTRNSRDFDELALALSKHYRVVCVDIAGRGLSGWLTDAKAYNYATYAAQLGCVMAHVNAGTVRWIGTSMGGILGMLLAATASSPVIQIVISDVGPIIRVEPLKRIAQYVSQTPSFGEIGEVEQYLRKVHSGFGALEEHQWRHLAEHSVRHHQGTWRLHYDPAIAAGFAEIAEDVDLSSTWNNITCAVLVLRGAESDLLPTDIAGDMAQRENVTLIELPGVGHAPMMMSAQELTLVEEFFCHR